MEHLRIVSCYVTQLLGKITNLEYLKYIRKVFSEMTYLVRSFMAFKPNEVGYDRNHGIVCSNDPILCTCVHLGMQNNVDVGGLFFLCTKKSIFHFLTSTNVFFCEAPTKKPLQIWANKNFKHTIPHYMQKEPTSCI